VCWIEDFDLAVAGVASGSRDAARVTASIFIVMVKRGIVRSPVQVV
jgi:hypothetical protein